MPNVFSIGIPTINRGIDLLMPSLIMYSQKDFRNTDIYVIDNGKQGLKQACKNLLNVVVIEQEHNIGVAASWNLLCKEHIFPKGDYALIINDDIYLGYGEQSVHDAIRKNKSGFVQAYGEKFSAFCISKKLFNTVGDFDEEFYPAYFEDDDYLYRMRLLNLNAEKSASLVPAMMRVSSSIQRDSSLNNNYLKLQQRYIDKWGGLPRYERFKKPFSTKR